MNGMLDDCVDWNTFCQGLQICVGVTLRFLTTENCFFFWYGRILGMHAGFFK